MRFDELATPAFTGVQVVEPALETLRDYIDCQFFFHTWELKGRYPAIIAQPVARELFDDAQTLLDEIVRDRLLVARGVYGFWPANSVGDDIVVYKDDARRQELARFPMLRQQEPIADGRPNRSSTL